MVGKNELRGYLNAFAEGRHKPEGWLVRNIVLSSTFAGGLLVMAAIGSTITFRAPAGIAVNSSASELSSSERVGPSGSTILELMSTAPLDLPVRPDDEPTF